MTSALVADAARRERQRTLSRCSALINVFDLMQLFTSLALA